MKVLVSNESITKPVFPLSISDIVMIDGVYQKEGNSSTYHIIVKGARMTSILVFDSMNGTLYSSQISEESTSRFRTIDRRVVFGLK